MRETPLIGEYAATGGKVVDFHGWALPVQFAGILEEHAHTRTAVSIFDCSHMGEFRIRGAAAIAKFHDLVISDIAKLKIGRVRYGAVLNHRGGIIDDITTYRVSDDELFVVTNAGPLDEVSALFTALDPGVEDISNATAKIDVQGPEARRVMAEIGVAEAEGLAYFAHGPAHWNGQEFLLSRTGYTGELGFELYIPADMAVPLWRALIAVDGVKAAGLGARDTLRTEVGYGLSGQDFGPDRTPLEANMAPFIAWDTPFQGKDALGAQREAGQYETLSAIRTADRRAPRHDFEVFAGEAKAGVVTSGTFGPSVGHGIGLAYLAPQYTTPGTALTAGPRALPIEVVELPFYRQGTCRT